MTIHEIEDHRSWAPDESPGEHWARCTCGEEMSSQDSIGGPATSIGEMLADHLADVEPDTADCGESQ